MRYLFAAREEITHRVRSAGHVLLLLDYDGTLTPIVERPEWAILAPQTKARLQDTLSSPAYTLGIISGRALGEIREMVGVQGIVYAGNHGLELEGPGISFVHPAAVSAKTLIQSLHNSLSQKLGHIPGIMVENKGLTLSIHYRLVDDSDLRSVKNIFESITIPLLQERKIMVSQGKKVYEVRPPVSWDKGKAVDLLLALYRGSRGQEHLLPIFLGDDLTDEDAFRAVLRAEGIAIFVGDGDSSSCATYFLSSTLEIERFLAELNATVPLPLP